MNNTEKISVKLVEEKRAKERERRHRKSREENEKLYVKVKNRKI